MNKDTNKLYKSKISKSLTIIVIVAILITPTIMLYHSTHIWEVTSITIITSLLCIPSLFYTQYRIKKDTLFIRSGLFYRKNIAVISIYKIQETNNMISSPATSMDRLEIFFNKYDSVLISPKDKTDFLITIQKLNPEIEVIYKNNKTIA